MNVEPLYPPEANTGEPWGEIDTAELLEWLANKRPVCEIATFLCRTPKEIRDRARDLGCGYLLIER